jgi:protein-tyrosine-phosphatase
VVFVCSGNICRSPMAEAYFRHRVETDALEGLEADSAGTLRIRKARASAEAIEAMAEVGVDLEGHRSKGVSAKVLASSDVTIGMSHDHLDYLAAKHPEGEDERLLLRAFEDGWRPAPNPRDLEDPIGHPLDFYREQVRVITRCVDNLIDYITRDR